MEKTRQPIPAGLAEMPPGPALAAVLAGIDLSRLGGLDCVAVLRAQHRQAAHEAARLLGAIVEVARCGPGPDDALPRMDAPDEFSADEIRGALAWTRAAADAQLSLGWDLHSRLPQVLAALDRGTIDLPKAKVLSEWTSDLTDAQARRICDQLLPEAPELTTGQLIDRIKKMAIAIDPDWARRRYEHAVRDRTIVGYRNTDGTANLCGYQLPADRAAAACANLDTLARTIKRSGDSRPINHIRADLYLAMLDGSYTGWDEQAIIEHMLATARQTTQETASTPARSTATGPHRPTAATHPAAQPDHHPTPQAPAHERADHEPVNPSAQRPSHQQPSDHEPATTRMQRPHHGRPAQRAGVEIRAELTTLLGLDDHPGEIAGSGPVHADLARRLVAEQTAAEWRYAITDHHGRLLYEGITTRRPTGHPSRADAPTHGGIVELHIPLPTLHHLAAHPEHLDGWGPVITDLARQADRHEHDTRHDEHVAETVNAARRDSHAANDSPTEARPNPHGHDGGGHNRGGRTPGKPMRRHTEIRDRTCTHPRCRTPAHHTDSDHIKEWAQGGPTTYANTHSACRHDHRLRHEGGWTVRRLRPGDITWISRLGVHYHVRPPLIIQPLPDPIPRGTPPSPPDGDQHDELDAPTWQEPAAPADHPPRTPTERPPPDPDEPIPF